MSQTRRLAAILAADVAGYSRLIGADENGTLQALKAIRAELIDPTIVALARRHPHQFLPLVRGASGAAVRFRAARVVAGARARRYSAKR
jgi:adenylate cyclase